MKVTGKYCEKTKDVKKYISIKMKNKSKIDRNVDLNRKWVFEVDRTAKIGDVAFVFNGIFFQIVKIKNQNDLTNFSTEYGFKAVLRNGEKEI